MLRLDNIEVRHDPFPHAILSPALDEHEYWELERTYPDYRRIVELHEKVEQNRLYQYHASDVLYDSTIPPVWRRFFGEHTSREFFDALAGVLPIYEYYPHLRDADVGLRHRDKSVIQMDCLFGVNTPVLTEGSVKGPHLDNPHELYACLIYFPVHGDGAGGDMTLYRYTNDRPRFYGQRFTDDVEPFQTVPYQPNTAVLFLNTFHALHGVTSRKVTHLPRRYVNIECEINMPLFEIRR